MPERILFLTGHLARPRLEKVLSELPEPGFDWSIHDIGVKVAALMTETIISRRLPRRDPPPRRKAAILQSASPGASGSRPRFPQARPPSCLR